MIKRLNRVFCVFLIKKAVDHLNSSHGLSNIKFFYKIFRTILTRPLLQAGKLKLLKGQSQFIRCSKPYCKQVMPLYYRGAKTLNLATNIHVKFVFLCKI